MRSIEFDSSGLKKCVHCKDPKTKEDFYPSISYKSGYRLECIECAKKKSKKYPKSSEQIKAGHLRCDYGITPEIYKRMLIEQNNVCAICGKEETVKNYKDKVSSLAVDHDHKTGKIRGLLCQKCNSGLGKFEDNEDNMLKAVEYLRKHKR